MTAEDLVQGAIDELYSVDPDEFMPRRTALAAEARTTDKDAGKEIAALRKPTRSAYVLNQLVRSDPEVAVRLAELGEHLLAAQEALDGAKLRELSTLRRGLVEELADQAFSVAGQRSPPPAMRDEVVSTLNAAIADESVVDQLQTGTLLRSARWDGFGFASPPELSVVRPSASRRPRGEPAAPAKTAGRASADTPALKKATTSKATTPEATKADRQAAHAAARAEAKAEAKAAVKAEEQRRRSALAQAQRTVREADAALAKATKAEEEQKTRVRHLHEQLTDARRRLDELRIDVRRAENRQRKAQQALDRQSK